MLQGVINNFPQQVEQLGVAEVKRFSVSSEEARSFNMRALFSGNPDVRLEAGEFVKLTVDGVLMMSDTRMERVTNKEFIDNAHGEVMIAGLGIGLILENLIPLCNSGVVTKVVVYEKYQDVIDLVTPRYLSKIPLEVRCADILTYYPPKDEKYDTLYFDIWPGIDEDNLKEVNLLHNRWKYRKKDGAWMSSWMADYLRRRRASERRSCWF